YPEQWGKLYLNLTDYYLKNFMPDSAINIAEKTLEINSTDITVKAKIDLGQAYLDKGKTNEAREIFDQCITAYLNSPMVWNGWMKLAGIYEYDFQYKDAVTIYQKVFRECSQSSQIPWIAAIKIGEILYRDSSQYGDSLFSLVVSGEHPFPGPRLIAQFYLGQITESTFKTEWNRLFPDSRLYLYYFARKAVFKDESVVATLYLKEFRNNLSKKSWDYFRTIKILNNLNRW
ncbi:MAG: tetratricopeptide repeat protein, partial [Fibrobacter sp.]|nr:tetratricopeptide repeat protein [Fibrobacter sp.]